MRSEISAPLHGSRVFAHGRLADHFGIFRHASESIGALAQDDHFSLRIDIRHSRRLGDFVRGSGKRP
jgi:hypothetical protein